MALCLEQDVVRGLLGGWLNRETESGRLARELCIAMARAHLLAGHDVVVPQFIALAAYLDRLANLADETEAEHLEVVLLDHADAAEDRFHARVHDPLWSEHQKIAARFIAEAGGYAHQYERLIQGIKGRNVVEIRSVQGDIDGTYAALIAAAH